MADQLFKMAVTIIAVPSFTKKTRITGKTTKYRKDHSKDDEDLKDIRPLIWDQLDMYITQTKRF